MNVYNPTIDGGFIKDALAEAVLGNLIAQKQTVQVAIQSQMRATLEYNAALATSSGLRQQSVLTEYVGHSQGTINGNLAIDRMSAEEKSMIRVFAVGPASWHLPKGLAGFVNIADKNDPVTRWTSGRAISKLDYALERPDTYREVETNIDVTPGISDPGNHHSFYLYANTQAFRSTIGFVNTPSVMTRPFAKSE